MTHSKQDIEDQMYMAIAEQAASRSHDPKFGVGCVIVTPDDMMTLGWNGTPPGDDNATRHPVLRKCEHGALHLQMHTKPTVMHAEFNALAKFAGSTASAEGARLYATHSPCLPCAIHIYRSKIKEVVYGRFYEASHGAADGRPFLEEHGVRVRAIRG